MPADDLVSIVMPVFNAEAFLAKALHSIKTQSHTNWEVIIVNDASVDASDGISRDWARQQVQRVELLQNSCRQGPGYSRNRALNKATGELIAFLDADDIWKPDRLAAGIEHFKRSKNLGVSYGRIIGIIKADGQKAGAIRLESSFSLPQLLWEGPHSASNVMVLKAVLESCAQSGCYFDESLMHTEDSELWWRIAAQSPATIESIDKHLLDYRVYGSSGGDIEKQIEGKILALQRAKAYIPLIIEEYGRLSLASTYRYLSRREIAMGAPTKAWPLIKKAVELDHRLLWISGVKTWSTLLAASLFHLFGCKDKEVC